jgi:hypothetical protein
MLGMILVDNSGPKPPWFLDHAEWNGLTPADLIFPSFIFIMGMAVPLAINKNNPIRFRNLFRIAALFAIGVFLNLSARKFTFNHCNYSYIYSSNIWNFTENKFMLWWVSFNTCDYTIWLKNSTVYRINNCNNSFYILFSIYAAI